MLDGRRSKKNMNGTQTIPIATPDKSTAPQPSDNGSFWAQIRAQLSQYVVSNLAASVVTAWSVFLFAGGLIFLVYFWSIGFMPEMDAKTLVTLLAVAALTGGCLFLMMSVYMVAPGYYWVHVTRHISPLKSPLWFFWPMALVILSFVLSNVLIQKWWWWVVPLLVTLIAPLPFLFPLRAVLETLNFKHKPHENPVDTNLYIRSYRISLSPPKSPERLKRLGKSRSRQKWREVLGFYAGFILSILFFTPVFLIMNILVGTAPDLSKNKTSAIATFLSIMLDILLVNVFIIRRLSAKQSNLKAILQCLIVGGITLFMVLLILQSLPVIPKSVMHIYKFGNLPNVSLVLDEIGCSLVQHHGVKVTPSTPNPTTATTPSPTTATTPSPTTATTPSPKTCSLSKVTIHSRLGSPYYLEASRNENTSVCFTIPAQNVLSWAIDVSKTVPTNKSSTSTQNPATTTETPSPNKCIEPTH
jgi:hypothetical protein